MNSKMKKFDTNLRQKMEKNMKQYIYGKNPIMEALKGASVYKIYMLNGHKDQKIFDLCKRNQIPLEFVDKKEFDKKVGKVVHQGVMAYIENYRYYSIDEILNSIQPEKQPLLLMLDGLEDPHNLGAILRTCDAIGVDGVIIGKNRSVGLNATVAKVSTGAIHHVKVAQVTNLTRTLEDLKKEPEISVQEEKKKSSPLRKGENTEKSSETTDPFQSIQSMKDADGILGLVVPDGQAVSAKTISLEDCLLKRDCEKGTCKKSGKGGWYERILMQEFLKPEIGNFIEPAEDAALSYGTEYLIAGNESDEKNLKETVNKLLLLRETLNFLYLQQDKAKNAEAEVLAATLAGATANPAIIELVHQGILAAWAYAESVCDVRTLLAKGQVPLMKDAAVWKTQLSNLGEAATMPADDKTSGLSYQEYLDALLYTQSTKKIAYRGMDLMEQSMRHEEKYAKCRMDHMITEFHADMTYEADTLFLGLFGEDLAGSYQFLEKTGYAYQ